MYYSEDDECESVATTERIPVELLRPFLNRGHVLYTDNFYTSPCKFLLNNVTFLCGTIKNNRKSYCKVIKQVVLQKGQASFFKGEFKPVEIDPNDEIPVVDDVPTQNLLAYKFRALQKNAKKQPKIVFMLSSLHNVSMVDIGKIDKDVNRIIKLATISAYNQHMGFIDRVDQQLHRVRALRKNIQVVQKADHQSNSSSCLERS